MKKGVILNICLSLFIIIFFSFFSTLVNSQNIDSGIIPNKPILNAQTYNGEPIDSSPDSDNRILKDSEIISETPDDSLQSPISGTQEASSEPQPTSPETCNLPDACKSSSCFSYCKMKSENILIGVFDLIEPDPCNSCCDELTPDPDCIPREEKAPIFEISDEIVNVLSEKKVNYCEKDLCEGHKTGEQVCGPCQEINQDNEDNSGEELYTDVIYSDKETSNNLFQSTLKDSAPQCCKVCLQGPAVKDNAEEPEYTMDIASNCNCPKLVGSCKENIDKCESISLCEVNFNPKEGEYSIELSPPITEVKYNGKTETGNLQQIYCNSKDFYLHIVGADGVRNVDSTNVDLKAKCKEILTKIYKSYCKISFVSNGKILENKKKINIDYFLRSLTPSKRIDDLYEEKMLRGLSKSSYIYPNINSRDDIYVFLNLQNDNPFTINVIDHELQHVFNFKKYTELIAENSDKYNYRVDMMHRCFDEGLGETSVKSKLMGILYLLPYYSKKGEFYNIKELILQSSFYPKTGGFYSECAAITDILLNWGGKDKICDSKQNLIKFVYEGQRTGTEKAWVNAFNKYYKDYLNNNNLKDLENLDQLSTMILNELKKNYNLIPNKDNKVCNSGFCNDGKTAIPPCPPATSPINPPLNPPLPQPISIPVTQDKDCLSTATTQPDKDKVFINNLETSLKKANQALFINNQKITDILKPYDKDSYVIMTINTDVCTGIPDYNSNIKKFEDNINSFFKSQVKVSYVYVKDKIAYPDAFSLMIFDKNGYFKNKIIIDLKQDGMSSQIFKVIYAILDSQKASEKKCPAPIISPKECPKPNAESTGDQKMDLVNKFNEYFSKNKEKSFKEWYGLDINPDWFSKKDLLNVIIITNKSDQISADNLALLEKIKQEYKDKKINFVIVPAPKYFIPYLSYYVIDFNGNNYREDYLDAKLNLLKDNFYDTINKLYDSLDKQCNPSKQTSSISTSSSENPGQPLVYNLGNGFTTTECSNSDSITVTMSPTSDPGIPGTISFNDQCPECVKTKPKCIQAVNQMCSKVGELGYTAKESYDDFKTGVNRFFSYINGKTHCEYRYVYFNINIEAYKGFNLNIDSCDNIAETVVKSIESSACNAGAEYLNKKLSLAKSDPKNVFHKSTINVYLDKNKDPEQSVLTYELLQASKDILLNGDIYADDPSKLTTMISSRMQGLASQYAYYGLMSQLSQKDQQNMAKFFEIGVPLLEDSQKVCEIINTLQSENPLDSYIPVIDLLVEYKENVPPYGKLANQLKGESVAFIYFLRTLNKDDCSNQKLIQFLADLSQAKLNQYTTEEAIPKLNNLFEKNFGLKYTDLENEFMRQWRENYLKNACGLCECLQHNDQ